MSDLHQALEAQQQAFRPDQVPPLSTLQDRKRSRDRRRATAGAALGTVALVGGIVAVPPLVDGRDTVRSTPAAPGVDAEEQRFGPELARLDDPGRDHVPGQLSYPGFPARPPMGGDHNPTPQQCAVYAGPVPAEHAVHSLEHGASWVTYRPDLAPVDVDRLAALVRDDPFRLMSQLPGQEAPVVVTAWGRQLPVERADDPRVALFLETYTNGPLTPEKGAPCQGNASVGTVPTR